MSVAGASGDVPAPMQGLALVRWKSPAVGSTKRGSVSMLPPSQLRVLFVTVMEDWPPMMSQLAIVYVLIESFLPFISIPLSDTMLLYIYIGAVHNIIACIKAHLHIGVAIDCVVKHF